MLMGWNPLAAFAAVVFTVLSFIGQPRLRRRMRAGAVSSALIFIGLLAGPPYDLIAGSVLLALVIWLVVRVIWGGATFQAPPC
jgi:hypothetical protein